MVETLFWVLAFGLVPVAIYLEDREEFQRLDGR